MNQPYDPPRRDQSGPADLAGFLVLGGCAVLGVFWLSLIHISRSRQACGRLHFARKRLQTQSQGRKPFPSPDRNFRSSVHWSSGARDQTMVSRY